MYSLPYFKASDEKEVLALKYHHPFVVLIACDAENHPVATHIPVLIE